MGNGTERRKFCGIFAILLFLTLTACSADGPEGMEGEKEETLPNAVVVSESIEDEAGKTESENQTDSNGSAEGAGILEGQIKDQSFPVELDGWGNVTFASFEPLEHPSENPDYGTTMFEDVRFMLLSEGKAVYTFPGEMPDDMLSGMTRFSQVVSVAFKDYDEDGRTDILLLLEYMDSGNLPVRRARVYTQEEGEKEFRINTGLSDYLGNYTENMSGMEDGIRDYRGSITEETTMSEEELTDFIRERSSYYTKSAYYGEIMNYWENVREVRDISCHMEYLFETDRKYLTKEELADEPLTVIHLAKNEIYARHGYIFRDEDLYHYFLYYTWYMPVTAPEDFSDGVFNEYERANLELLDSLDTL